jgi:hypothetical protein
MGKATRAHPVSGVLFDGNLDMLVLLAALLNSAMDLPPAPQFWGLPNLKIP